MIESTLSLPMLTAVFVGMVIGYEILRLLVSLVFGRFVSPGFVKTSDCEKCGAKSAASDVALRKDIRAIKRVLFSMATNGEINEDDLKDLVT